MLCLACGQTSSRPSREHVFPAWLLKFLKVKRVPMNMYRRRNDGTKEPHRAMILDSFKLRRICTSCNSGWMSRLENRARPLVLDLINGSVALESLGDDQRKLLARWAGKTAIIETHAVGAESPVDGRLLRWMRSNEDATPGRFAVVAASNQYGGVGHMQVGVIRDLIGGETVAGNIVVLAFPNLILTCGFPIPDLDWRCRCDLALYRPMWPDIAAWEPMKNLNPFTCSESDPLTLLETLAERIELFQPVL